MDSTRLILFVIFSVSILMLWDAWQLRQRPHPTTVVSQPATTAEANLPKTTNISSQTVQEVGHALQNKVRVSVKTDLIRAEIDTMGGDLRRVELLKHGDSKDRSKPFVLLDDSHPPAVYVAQSGLLGDGLPTHKSQFAVSQTEYELKPNQEMLEVHLGWQDGSGLEVDKVYIFRRGSYVVDVRHDIRNNTTSAIDVSAYYQIVHDSETNQSSIMMPTFTGAAFYTEADKFKKVSFSDMEKTNLSHQADNGWIGMVQHYFVSAWILPAGQLREYYTKRLSNKVYSMGVVSPLGSIQPGTSLATTSRYYVGPQEQSHLKEVAPGLEYTVDYGLLTVIAAPLFWVLAMIQKLVHNWGVAIILLTVLIKLVFYPLSAASYRSMAHMRELAPRLQLLKEQCGDDRQKLHQAMMELYRKEKINPMGGCLPILVQIPVFIALYWVLLGSVEMRQAPFALWIQDLSSPDPYYVLPILMGATMIIQTKLNPTPPDPIQARIMMIMPIVFSVFFFFFPAGLVLYWLVNNVLSIAQQWHINHTISQLKKGHARP